VLYEFTQVSAIQTADLLATTSNWLGASTAYAVTFPTAYVDVAEVASGGWLVLGSLVSSILGFVVYATVWVVWNVIDVTILILPVPFLDAILKSVRHGAMSLVFGTAAISPWLGLIVSLLIIFICWCLAGWAFRLSVMGFVFATDFLLWRKPGAINATVGVPAFTTAVTAKRWKRPARLYGRLLRGPDDSLYFTWRPWLIGPKQRMNLGYSRDYQGGSTLLYPVVLENADEKLLFRLPPRYRHDSRKVAGVLGLRGWRDVSVVRGFFHNIRELFRQFFKVGNSG